MAKYNVTMKVEGYFKVEVDADNVGQAMRNARGAFYDYTYDHADFGELEDIDVDIVSVEDKDTIWYY